MSTEKFPGLLNGMLCNQKRAEGAGAVVTCQCVSMVGDQAALTHNLTQRFGSVILSDQVDGINGQIVERLLKGMLRCGFLLRIAFEVHP